ncbi:hypothetical protein AB0B25_07660 [Nocardia sp. NPDC049190]|uniref:hypothetical protein n=1 Tax=Nocardia sp. NPDC049190 TaxID=3155650 RepID=UPI0034071CAB
MTSTTPATCSTAALPPSPRHPYRVKTGGISGDPVIEVIAMELHRLRRVGAAATILTRGGYLHQHVRVHAVHRHHTVLDSDTHSTVLLPLRFIESVQPLDTPIRQE